MPFQKTSNHQKSYSQLVEFDAKLSQAKDSASNCVGYVMGLYETLLDMPSEACVSEMVNEVMAECDLDDRSTKNYGIVLFVTAKVKLVILYLQLMKKHTNKV